MLDDKSIRLASLEDADAIAAIYRPIVLETTISFEDVPPSAAEMRTRIASSIDTFPWLVCEGNGVLGYVYASQHRARAAYRWSVDVSAYVREDSRKAGVATALYQALFRLLKLQRFHRAYAGVALPNDASIGLHRSLGFEPVGVYRSVGFKHGAWWDSSWWQRPLSDDAPPAGEPIPLRSLDPDAASRFISGKPGNKGAALERLGLL